MSHYFDTFDRLLENHSPRFCDVDITETDSGYKLKFTDYNIDHGMDTTYHTFFIDRDMDPIIGYLILNTVDKAKSFPETHITGVRERAIKSYVDFQTPSKLEDFRRSLEVFDGTLERLSDLRAIHPVCYESELGLRYFFWGQADIDKHMNDREFRDKGEIKRNLRYEPDVNLGDIYTELKQNPRVIEYGKELEKVVGAMIRDDQFPGHKIHDLQGIFNQKWDKPKE